MKEWYSLFVFMSLMITQSAGQVPVERLDLPDPFISRNGEKAGTKTAWENQRRPELLKLFREQVYGSVPDNEIATTFELDYTDKNALCGRAVSKSVTVLFHMGGDTVSMHLMIYLPADATGPAPLFLGLNFYGNHTIHSGPNIPITKSWMRNNPNFCITDNRADHLSRGVRANRWPVERILERGYGLATIYCGDIDPDFHDGFENGIHRLTGQPAADEWGTISAWAWGLSRAMDYFEQDADIDEKQVAVIGHSRLGKTSLWAGAQDQRFALVISNNSGCGGAALSRRKAGESLQDINDRFPHWFCHNFHRYNGREEALPVDQHMLIALIAPRPVYVASAEQDQWADPRGEYLSLYFAAPVYELLGYPSPLAGQQPAANAPVRSGKLAYHIRSGGHDITRYDWEQYLDFADGYLGR